MASLGKKKKGKPVEEEESCFCMSAQPLMPDMVLERYGEMIFEDFKFNACLIGSSAGMAYKYAMGHVPVSQDLALVVDSGFSFTYAVPILRGVPMKFAAT